MPARRGTSWMAGASASPSTVASPWPAPAPWSPAPPSPAMIAAIALGFALVAYSPEIALFGFFVLYGLSGYVLAALGLFKRKVA